MRVSWRRLPGNVTHLFTHFPLRQVVYVARVPAGAKAPVGMRWVALAELAGQAHEAMQAGEQNQAIGTILDFDRLLPEAQALYNAAIALHRGR